MFLGGTSVLTAPLHFFLVLLPLLHPGSMWAQGLFRLDPLPYLYAYLLTPLFQWGLVFPCGILILSLCWVPLTLGLWFAHTLTPMQVMLSIHSRVY